MVNRFVEALFGRQPDNDRPTPPGVVAPTAPAGANTAPDPGLATDPRPAADQTQDEELSAIERSLVALRAEVRRAGGALPTIVISRIGQIDDLLRIVLMTAQRQGASTEQRYLLNAMITDYLPSPMRSFLALPETDRDDSSRSTAVFAEQLGILEETIRDLLNQVRIGAIEELSTHGRFLAEKFAAPTLRLDRE